MDYREYYARCRALYGERSNSTVYDLGVHPQVPGRAASGDPFALSAGYLPAVRAVADEVDRRIAAGTVLFHNRDRRVRDLAIQLDEFWDIEALERIAEILVPQVEERVLGCHGLINQVNVIRSVPEGGTPASSWLWHYDNCPDEAFKVLIYLTEVDAESGAFEYLRHPDTGAALRVPSSRISAERVNPARWPKSRVPASVVESYRAEGYEPYRVEGPPGTLILFDNNCIHRATVPTRRHRDAAILSFRPTHEPIRPYISRRHTGSWSYNAKQWTPEVLAIAP